MINDHVRMWWRVVFLGLVMVAGCTKPNPRSCADGSCSDPTLPFCDVDGALEGQANTCIAVECTPMEFAGCRGDLAITCNTVGSDFDLIECQRGCEEASGGCRLCDPDETACTNGTVATCDANGAVVSSESCPLGCFEAEPRCRDLDPSNSLGQFLDTAKMTTDLDLSSGGSINTSTGEVRDTNNMLIPVSTVLLPSQSDGAAIRVLIARQVRLGNVRVIGTGNQLAPALAILANDEITIEGELALWYDDFESAFPTPGGVSSVSCNGRPGVANFQGPQTIRSGYGGGGHATAGGKGGSVEVFADGGAAGSASGNASLEPLRGGCTGGGPGGGAVQLCSRRRITISDGGQINANGQIGAIAFQGPAPLLGGGAGGGILLEAPTLNLGSGSALLVNGGPAATEAVINPTVSRTTAPSQGGTCTSGSSFRCGKGGDGAGLSGPATDGADVPYISTQSVTSFVAAGGGGGLGYIRINTRTGEYTKASDSIESGVLTTSMLRTR